MNREVMGRKEGKEGGREGGQAGEGRGRVGQEARREENEVGSPQKGLGFRV
jgi:hypothetical protein